VNDFYTRQAINRRRSALLLVAFVGIFLALGVGLDVVWGGFLAPGGEPFPVLTLGSAAVASMMSASAYFGGTRLVMGSLHARPLDPTNPEERQLQNIVTEMALAAGLPQPQVFVIPDLAPNALAAGRDPQHAGLAVTQGLLNLCDREETQGVIAHEMAHIGNRDTLTMTLVGILLGGVLMLADWARRGLYLGRDERRSGNAVVFVLVLVLVAVTPLLSRLLAMAVSRQREYLADATGAQFTRNPGALAAALEKIDRADAPTRSIRHGTAHLCITDPLGRLVTAKEGFLADLLATHPPMARRIARLKQMAYQYQKTGELVEPAL